MVKEIFAGAVNLAFFDSHGETVPWDYLWQLD